MSLSFLFSKPLFFADESKVDSSVLSTALFMSSVLTISSAVSDWALTVEIAIKPTINTVSTIIVLFNIIIVYLHIIILYDAINTMEKSEY